MHPLFYVFVLVTSFSREISGFAPHPTHARELVEERDVDEILSLFRSLYTDLVDQNNATEREIALLRQTVSQQQVQIDSLKGSQAPQEAVGFTATMTHGYYYPVDKSLIPFAIAISNFGHHYSPVTGQFICPVSGMYFFSISLHSGPLDISDHATTVADIMVASQPVGNAFCGNLGRADMYLQCATSVIVHCLENTPVWVRSRGKSSQFAGDSEKLSNFAGFLVQKIDEEE